MTPKMEKTTKMLDASRDSRSKTDIRKSSESGFELPV